MEYQSLPRSSSVHNWKQCMGDLPDSCFVVRGFAVSESVSSNDSESGRAANVNTRRTNCKRPRIAQALLACLALSAGIRGNGSKRSQLHNYVMR
jgi:hypothetical protein